MIADSIIQQKKNNITIDLWVLFLKQLAWHSYTFQYKSNLGLYHLCTQIYYLIASN